MKKPRKRRKKVPRRPSLRFNPTAYAKLRFLRDYGETEIGGFGISSEDDPLLIEDVLPVRQSCTPTTVAFDDAAVADLFDDLVDDGLKPERFGRIWIHTHPGDCPLPSSIDEATFRRVFGRTDWSVMAILARNDAAYARLSFHVGPGGSLEIPVRVDFSGPFDGSDREVWEQAYHDTVVVTPPPLLTSPLGPWKGGPFLLDEPETLAEWEAYYGDADGVGSV